MNICVIMWYDENVKEYAELNYIINKTYCDKYGYNIIKSDLKRTSLSPHWERIPLAIEHLNNYDYVIWIDSDANFLKDAPPITNVIKEHNEKLFILSGDVSKKEESDINTGFFIVKNSPICFEILKFWYTDLEVIANKANKKHGYIEDQGGFRYMYSLNLFNLQNISVTIPYGILQTFPRQQSEKLNNINKYGLTDKAFVSHMAGCCHKERIVFSTLYLKYNFNTICKCGLVKDKNTPTCCFYCYKNKGHGPLCQFKNG